jgi:hypothetical protein
MVMKPNWNQWCRWCWYGRSDISTISRVPIVNMWNTVWYKTDQRVFSESMKKRLSERCFYTRNQENPSEYDWRRRKKPLQTINLPKSWRNYQSRRTIAKYREQLDIPVARMRKKMVFVDFWFSFIDNKIHFSGLAFFVCVISRNAFKYRSDKF